MHELKEEFRTIYKTSKNGTEGMIDLSEWMAKSANILTKSCQTIRNWFGEIISYFERRTTNGVVEGINNKLKLIKRRGYGFRNFCNFWVRSILSWHLVCWFSIKSNEEPLIVSLLSWLFVDTPFALSASGFLVPLSFLNLTGPIQSSQRESLPKCISFCVSYRT